MNSYCKVIWWNKLTLEWRQATDKFGSSPIHVPVKRLFQDYRLIKIQKEYFRKIYQLGLK
jgi:hypothetical protein